MRQSRHEKNGAESLYKKTAITRQLVSECMCCLSSSPNICSWSEVWKGGWGKTLEAGQLCCCFRSTVLAPSLAMYDVHYAMCNVWGQLCWPPTNSSCLAMARATADHHPADRSCSNQPTDQTQVFLCSPASRMIMKRTSKYKTLLPLFLISCPH